MRHRPLRSYNIRFFFKLERRSFPRRHWCHSIQINHWILSSQFQISRENRAFSICISSCWSRLFISLEYSKGPKYSIFMSSISKLEQGEYHRPWAGLRISLLIGSKSRCHIFFNHTWIIWDFNSWLVSKINFSFSSLFTFIFFSLVQVLVIWKALGVLSSYKWSTLSDHISHGSFDLDLNILDFPWRRRCC